jgi:hypothetical protein
MSDEPVPEHVLRLMGVGKDWESLGDSERENIRRAYEDLKEVSRLATVQWNTPEEIAEMEAEYRASQQQALREA